MLYPQVSKKLPAFIGLILLLLFVVHVESDRQGSARRLENNGGFKSNCGDAHQVSGKIGRCLDPFFELIEGKVKIPTTDNDILAICERFGYAERCTRAIAKDCLTGLHKTTVSTIVSAIKRFKGQECKTTVSRARYFEPMKCNNLHSREIITVIRNHTAIAQGVRDLPVSPEEKLLKTCCILSSLDKSMGNIFNTHCPASAPPIMGIFRAMTDDVRATLCRNPRCNGALDGVSKGSLKQQQNFIEPAMEILFKLRTD